MRATIFKNGDYSNLTAAVVNPDTGQTELLGIDNSHPYWEDIVDAVYDGDEDAVLALMDLEVAVENTFRQVTERITVSNETVYFDGEPVHNSLADAILRAGSPDGLLSLAKFMEKAYSNPRRHSRDNLFNWLNTHAFTITPEGDLIGYKGVGKNLKSITGGPGIVNGVPTSGHLDNSVGNVLEMARGQVEHNPSRGCSSGLHVGTWDYASSFGHTTLKVLVNPRDVVSVPTDCSWAKMRVCRYKVLDVIERPVQTFIDPSWDDDWDESDEGWYAEV